MKNPTCAVMLLPYQKATTSTETERQVIPIHAVSTGHCVNNNPVSNALLGNILQAKTPLSILRKQERNIMRSYVYDYNVKFGSKKQRFYAESPINTRQSLVSKLACHNRHRPCHYFVVDYIIDDGNSSISYCAYFGWRSDAESFAEQIVNENNVVRATLLRYVFNEDGTHEVDDGKYAIVTYKNPLFA